MTTMTAFTSTDTDFSTKVKVQATSRGKSGLVSGPTKMGTVTPNLQHLAHFATPCWLGNAGADHLRIMYKCEIGSDQLCLKIFDPAEEKGARMGPVMIAVALRC